MLEEQIMKPVIPLAPFFVLKTPTAVEQKMLDLISQGNFFLHQTGPDAPKLFYALNRFCTFFKNSLRVYIPAHLIILLLRLRSRKDSKATLAKKYIIGVVRSSLFATFFAMSIASSRVTPPLYGIFNPRVGSWSGFIISALFSCFIFVESHQRWQEFALYVLAQWFEAFPNSLIKRKYISRVNHVEKVAMAFAIGLMVWLRFNEDLKKGERKNKMSSIIDFIIGTFETEKTERKLEEAKKVCDDSHREADVTTST